ncbi:MAG: copper chaperone PCu(A)C [Blastomonas sp.]
MIRDCLAAALLGSTVILAGCNAVPEADTPSVTETAASSIVLIDPWSRETAAGQNAGGAFMTIANTGTAADRLTGGSTPVAGRVEIHTMTMEGDVMQMRQLGDGLEIPAGGEVRLKPGSFHVMLMDLKQPLKAGEKVPLSLTFAGAGTVETELEVRPTGTMVPIMKHGEKEKPHG